MAARASERLVARRLVLPLALLIVTVALAACAGDRMPPALPAEPAPVEGHLLAFPHADAESLLGRAVTRSADGGLRIAEARAAGCDVIVHRKAAQYRSRRESTVARLSSVGVGYQQLVALEAKVGRESQVSLDLDNTELLEADLRGSCGSSVVVKVFVGRGKRRVFASASSAASAKVGTAIVGVTPATESKADNLDELTWTSNQAYAFDVRDFGPDAAVDGPRLDVRLPSILAEGEEVHISFESAKEAYLIVLYVDADGKGEILWPSNEEPAPRVTPGVPAVLPSAAEQAAGIKIRPTLASPGKKAREQFYVYAFGDRRDFDVLKPSAGMVNGDGVAYAAELAKKLAQVPASRWSRTVLSYVIEPRK